jgi:hypothetical protein
MGLPLLSGHLNVHDGTCQRGEWPRGSLASDGCMPGIRAAESTQQLLRLIFETAYATESRPKSQSDPKSCIGNEDLTAHEHYCAFNSSVIGLLPSTAWILLGSREELTDLLRPS